MCFKKFNIKGEVAIVTGGAGCIGKAIAIGFAESMANVIITDIVGQEAWKTAKAIENETGSIVRAMETNICKKEEVDKLVETTVKEFGTVDVLVNCAGTIHRPRTAAINFTEDAWNKVHDVNLKGALFCCQSAAKVMIKRKQGKIINIASSSGIKPIKNHIAYSTSKAGVIQLTKTLALELAEHNIRVNAIAPYYIRTPLNEVTLKNEAERKRILSTIPLGRIGEPEDVVNCCLFLASSASNWITGQTLILDGGAML